jgi:hypothetical protein
MNRYRGALFPLILIGLGLVALLANLGAISWDQVVRVLDLWPLLLIMIGIELIVRRLAAPPVATALGAAVAILALVAAVAHVAAGPGFEAAGDRGSAHAPLNSAEAGSLVFNGGAARITGHVADTGGDLYQATFTYPKGARPTFTDRPGEVVIDFGGGSHLFGRSGPRMLDIALSNRVPWSVDLRGGAFSIDLNLAEGHLRQFMVEGGASNITARLPAPSGTVPIMLQGGAISATLHRPAGVELRVRISGGASAIDADGNHVTALGGDSSWSTPGYSQAADRYEISAEGGANHVTVDSS